MNKFVKISSIVCSICLLSSCGKTKDTIDTTPIDSVATEAVEEIPHEVPEYTLLNDNYGFQYSKTRNDDSAMYVASVIIDGNNKSYSVYGACEQVDDPSLEYTNTSMVFVGDNCYLYVTQGVIGSNPVTDTAYKLTDVNYKESDFSTFNFGDTINGLLHSSLSYSELGEITQENESGTYAVQCYDCSVTNGIVANGHIHLETDCATGMLRNLSFESANTNMEYIQYEYQDDGTFTDIRGADSEMSYSEALEYFKDTMLSSEIAAASESIDAQKESFKYEEVLE